MEAFESIISAMRIGVLLCLLTAIVGLAGGWEDSEAERLNDFMLICSGGFGDASGTKWGYCKDGKLVIDTLFDQAGYFTEGLAAVKAGNKWGYIDTAARYVIGLQFDGAGPFFDGLAPAKAGRHWGFIRKDGAFAFRPQFDSALEFTKGLAPVKAGRKWGFVDTTGRYFIKPRFDGVEGLCFYHGLAWVKVAHSWIVIDKAGSCVYRASPRDIMAPFGSEPVYERIGDKYGYRDTTGTLIIAPQFDLAEPFFWGLAPVKVNAEWGYIDKTGRYVWKENSGKTK
jgi:hypothetical protein